LSSATNQRRQGHNPISIEKQVFPKVTRVSEFFKMMKMAFKGPVGDKIAEKITKTLKPIYLQVLNESHTHSVPKNSETHFKIICVSEEFEGKSIVENHRKMNHLLQEELSTGVHALSLVLRTPKQWETSNAVPASPACRGGSKHDH
jgi:stress-induced morphogen